MASTGALPEPGRCLSHVAGAGEHSLLSWGASRALANRTDGQQVLNGHWACTLGVVPLGEVMSWP